MTCVIVDNSVVGEVFIKGGTEQLEPAREFLRKINSKSFPVVAGGKLLTEELNIIRNFKQWFRQARLAGRGLLISDTAVAQETKEIERKGAYRSNDPHVIA